MPHETLDLANSPLASSDVRLLEGLCTTRAIRRYQRDPIPAAVLRDILFAATRAPSGSNRQPFRFMVLTDGPRAREAKALVQRGGRAVWDAKRRFEGYDRGSGIDNTSPKARLAASMEEYVDRFDAVPCLVLPCYVRYRAPHLSDGASIYPAVQNLLLAARALGYGGVITGFHFAVEAELKTLLDIPAEIEIACTVTLGKPRGHHGSVRRRPLGELVFGERWGEAADWAIDPPGTRFTQAGPPKQVG